MVGTPLEGRGGMSSVAAAYRDAGFFKRCGIRYLTPVADGGAGRKILAFLSAFFVFASWFFSADKRPSLVHIHVASGVSFWRKSFFAVFSMLFSCPVVMHLHGGAFIEFFRGCSYFGRGFVRRVLCGANRVIVLSSTWIEKVQEISSEMKISAFPNPVAVPELIESKHSDSLQFLFLGRLEQAKGVFDLLEAFAGLSADFPSVRLVLAGDGDFGAVSERLSALQISDQVSMPGWITGDKKRELLSVSDIFVLPSYIEGLPVSMLEAMAYGLPVVVSRVGSVPEVLVDGVNGLIVDIGDVACLEAALRRLAASSVLRSNLGDAGRMTVSSVYSTEGVCANLEALYREILECA